MPAELSSLSERRTWKSMAFINSNEDIFMNIQYDM